MLKSVVRPRGLMFIGLVFIALGCGDQKSTKKSSITKRGQPSAEAQRLHKTKVDLQTKSDSFSGQCASDTGDKSKLKSTSAADKVELSKIEGQEILNRALPGGESKPSGVDGTQERRDPGQLEIGEYKLVSIKHRAAANILNKSEFSYDWIVMFTWMMDSKNESYKSGETEVSGSLGDLKLDPRFAADVAASFSVQSQKDESTRGEEVRSIKVNSGFQLQSVAEKGAEKNQTKKGNFGTVRVTLKETQDFSKTAIERVRESNGFKAVAGGFVRADACTSQDVVFSHDASRKILSLVEQVTNLSNGRVRSLELIYQFTPKAKTDSVTDATDQGASARRTDKQASEAPAVDADPAE